jgi:hypothetical protein
VPGDAALRLEPRDFAQVACRTWAAPVVIAGWGAAVEGPLEVPPALEPGVARPPFQISGAVGERAPGARALLAALGRCIEPMELPPPAERALVIGTHTAALHEVITFLEEVRRVGPSLVNPGLFPFTVMNAAAGLAAIHYQCEGPNITLNNGQTSALDALAYAADLVASGQAEVAFAGGIESFGPQTGAAAGFRPPPASQITVSAVLAVTTLERAAALRGRSNVRLLAVGSGEACGLDPAAARDEIVAAVLRAATAVAAGSSVEPPVSRDGSRPDRTLLSLLESVHRVASLPAGSQIPLFAGPAESPSGCALVLTPA